jgi:hypothetical protein
VIGELVGQTIRPGEVLDWRDHSHWSGRRRCCIHCTFPAWLLDENGRPSHKTCTESARSVPVVAVA